MKLLFKELLKGLPAEYAGVLSFGQECNEYTIVVLDDDPTGCQTLHDVPVLFSWEIDELRNAFKERSNIFFILTNTRSLSEKEAVKRLVSVMKNVRSAGMVENRKYILISRSDSTLRGHYPLELDVIGKDSGNDRAMHALIPAFFQGGRYTCNDIHYVEEGEYLIPAAETPFARDRVFGFQHSNLKDYVEEKTSGEIKAEDVMSISLHEIRRKGPQYISEKILASKAQACVVNAMSQRDLDVLAAGAWEAIHKGKEVIFRTAASFLNSFGRIETKGPLQTDELGSNSVNGGLIVAGSFVEKTTLQLEILVNETNIYPLELNVKELFDDSSMDPVSSLVEEATNLIKKGENVVLFTSRDLYSETGNKDQLDTGKKISAAVVRFVRELKIIPSFLVVKGGITSHDVAEKALNIRSSKVIGQALPGVPVLIPENHESMKYIIFPGNVGGLQDLKQLYLRLTGE